MTRLDGDTLKKDCQTEDVYNSIKAGHNGYIKKCIPEYTPKCNNEYYSKYLLAEAKEG